MRILVRILVLVPLMVLVAAAAAGNALAQPGGRERGPGFKGAPAKMAPVDRRAEPPRGDPRRPERMSPEDREKLRRDIEDANRRMERRR